MTLESKSMECAYVHARTHTNTHTMYADNITVNLKNNTKQYLPFYATDDAYQTT